MSFLIAVHVNEGIVLASDRKTTYTNTLQKGATVIQRIGIHTTNSTDKTFACPNGAGISTCGEANVGNKPITGYILDMIRNRITKDTSIDEVPRIILDYFNGIADKPDSNFIVAGYKNIDGTQEQIITKVFLKSNKTEVIDASSQGATWEGETTTLTRLLQNVAIKSDKGAYGDLPYEVVPWEYMTLQDAVDFARYAVQVTIDTMHFKNVIETVGGAVDILVITPSETKWLQKENLH